MIEPEQTESEFDKFFETQGFSRVTLDIGQSPTFDNADYVNKEKRIIVELKILAKEQFENGGLMESLNSIIIKPVNIDEKGLGQYTFTLPEMNRNGRHDNFEEPLHRILKKANRQLRETKAYYYPESDSIGYVFLAQTGLTSLNPAITAKLVQKIIIKDFSSIDGVVICTPHSLYFDPVTRLPNELCVSVTKDNKPILRAECMNIADKWVKFFEIKDTQLYR